VFGVLDRDELVADDEPQFAPVLLRLQDRRLPLTREVLEGAGVEQRLLKLQALKVAHVGQRAGSRRPSRHGGSVRRSPLAEARASACPSVLRRSYVADPPLIWRSTA
jgi:hypothetical protein